MRQIATSAQHRRLARAEDALARAVMPRLAAQDAPLLLVAVVAELRQLVASRSGSRLVRPLTATLAEVARA